ncbi:hypothetical protein HanIR_Chr02g0056561 [Helianthus annuus]|nr:hypothetical protein HanIR_Chr02g0056561 [Helianthus annuus]
MHHPRKSGKSSSLAFDPEIERTVHQTRVFHRENKVLQSPTPHKTHKSMENSRIPGQTPCQPVATSSILTTPTQPSPNTINTSESLPQSTQTTTQIPPIPPPPFPNLDNLPPLPTQATSSQNPPFTQTSTAQYYSPYVRIVSDENIIPPN